MDYRIANIKPHDIDQTGIVTFTDGTNTGLSANQEICEAYGYTYDNRSGVCRLNQQFEASIEREFNRETNKVMGTSNEVETGGRNVLITGENNLIGGMSRNGFVTGTENQINSSVQNASVFGYNGEATRQSEFVIGGGMERLPWSDTYVYANRQMSIIELAGVTTGNTATNLTVNGDGSSYIPVKNNSIVGYEIYMTRFEFGGSSGTAGNYSYRNLKGVARIDNAYSMDFTTGMTRNIAKYPSSGGTNGSMSMVDVSVSDGVQAMTIQVSDRNNVRNIWSAIVYIHEMVSTSTTF